MEGTNNLQGRFTSAFNVGQEMMRNSCHKFFDSRDYFKCGKHSIKRCLFVMTANQLRRLDTCNQS